MKKKATPIECRDTGLALVFLALLLWLFTQKAAFVHLALAVLLAAMIYPQGLAWPARLWFGLARLLNLTVSKIILGLAYFLLVLPMALARRALGKDALKLKAWKTGEGSVFVARERRFAKEDLFRQF